MLYLYDRAIQEDLAKTFNPNHVPHPFVRVIETDVAIGLAAQLQKDNIEFPIVAVTRMPDTPIDTARTNFTRMHKGVVAGFDNDDNLLYHEKAIPIKLDYTLTVLCTRTSDMDELMRELMFKYINMYFLTIQPRYGMARKLRFGICLDLDKGIERKSGHLEYVASGQVYQSILPLKCEGCVLLQYTPVRLKTAQYEIEPALPGQT